MALESVQRRQVLKAIGIGAGVSVLGGVAQAKPPMCPDCPDGTRLLAKYEFNDDSGAFEFEKGACSDAVSDIQYTNKEGEENEPIEVSFTSRVFVDDLVVKYGRHCETSDSENVSFWQDEEKDTDGFESTLTIEDPSGPAISYFSLCAGVCYQADLVCGDPIEDLSEEQYGRERLVTFRWGGTAIDTGDSENFSPKESSDGDVVTTDDGIEFADGTASVSFDVDLNSDDLTLSLVSYAATCPPNFDRDTAYLQDLYDSTTVTYSADTTDQLEVELPGLDQLDELCEV